MLNKINQYWAKIKAMTISTRISVFTVFLYFIISTVSFSLIYIFLSSSIIDNSKTELNRRNDLVQTLLRDNGDSLLEILEYLNTKNIKSISPRNNIATTRSNTSGNITIQTNDVNLCIPIHNIGKKRSERFIDICQYIFRDSLIYDNQNYYLFIFNSQGDNSQALPLEVTLDSSTQSLYLHNVKTKETLPLPLDKDKILQSSYNAKDFAYTINTLKTPEDTYYFLLVYSLESRITFFQKIKSSLIFAGVVDIGILLIFTKIFVKSSLQPLTNLSNIAANININHTAFRISENQTNDEVGILIHSLNNMLERLNASYEKVKIFTSDASHELRIPITIIKGNIELIQTFKEDKTIVEESLKAIDEETDNMKKLIDDLMAISRIENKIQQPSLAPVNINDFMKKIHKESQQIFDHPFENQFATGKSQHSLVAYTDENMLTQSIRAIIENAVKYSDKDCKIQLIDHSNPKEVIITVKDCGIGIKEEDIEKITDRFYRSHSDRNRATGGTGLGLSIAKSSVDALGGTLEIKSKLGKGTEVSIHLPRTSY